MGNLKSLKQQIEQRLNTVWKREQSQREQMQLIMEEIEKRQREFQRVADDLMADVISPRMQTLASSFGDEAILESPQAGHHFSKCQFKHSSRLPATISLSLGIAHDEEIQQLLMVYDLEILPVFMKFDGHDQAGFPLQNPDRDAITRWVEEKILAFVDTYIRLQQTDQYHQTSLHTDPVCGMRFRETHANGKLDFAGQTYFFCSEGCLSKFQATPQQYVSE